MKDPSCWNSFRVPNWQHSGSESRIRIGIVSPLATATFHFCYKDELLTRRVERGRVMGEMRFGGSLIFPISRNHLGGGESGSRDRNYQDKECGENGEAFSLCLCLPPELRKRQSAEAIFTARRQEDCAVCTPSALQPTRKAAVMMMWEGLAE